VVFSAGGSRGGLAVGWWGGGGVVWGVVWFVGLGGVGGGGWRDQSVT